MASPVQAELAELKARLAESIPEAERAEVELRVGQLFGRIGELDQALTHLTDARKYFERHTDARRAAQADVQIAAICATKGEHERAQSFFERAAAAADIEGDPDLSARIANHVADAAATAHDRERALASWHRAQRHFESYWDGAELSRIYGGLARDHIERGELELAERLSEKGLEEAEAAADPFWLGRALMTRGEIKWKGNDLRGARRLFRRGISVFLEHDLRRELAEAYLRFGMFIGEAGEAMPDSLSDPPAFFLAKAQELFRDLGGLRDLERVRDAFRRFGRRATDKISEVEVLELLGDIKQNRQEVQRQSQKVVSLAMASFDQLTKGQPEISAVEEARQLIVREERALGLAVDQMALAEEHFIGALNTVILERENIRTLLELCRSLSTIQDYARLPGDIAKMAAQLTGADRALVALLDDDGEPQMRGAVRMSKDDRTWQEPIRGVISKNGNPAIFSTQSTPRGGDPAPRTTEIVPQRSSDGSATGAHSLAVARPPTDEIFLPDAGGRGRLPLLGRAMACPLRHGTNVFGAIYADKELCGGVFSERDLDLLAIFAAQVATILENTRVAEELRLAARTRSATLEAISDAVLSITPNGRVTPINNAAKRVLGSAGLDSPRLSLTAWPELAFLGGYLERGEELDGRVVRLTSGEFLLNTRAVRGDANEILGLVATLTEMKRATSLAQKIVGTTARFTFADIIGNASMLRRRMQLAEAAARSDSSVLVTGESGTGKELMAQAIHNAGPRAQGPFVGINCAAIPRELLESELFGYEAGAFTGAKKGGHPGKFELAEGGTILLDEIGDMPLEMQAKLLRVLQERRVQRLGGTKEIPLDTRVIATTNRDLAEDAERGRFRQDLFFRLRVIHIELPSLRERPEDIPILVEHFLALFSARLGKSVKGVTPEIMQVLRDYPWPGNVRELEHVLEGEVNLAGPGQQLLNEIPVMIESSTRRRARALALQGLPADSGNHNPITTPLPQAPPRRAQAHPDVQSIEDAERQLLVQALARHRGSVPDVAKSLGVSRGTVYNKMKKFQIDPTSYRGN